MVSAVNVFLAQKNPYMLWLCLLKFLEFFGIFVRGSLTLDHNWGSFGFSLVYTEDVFSVKYMLKCFTELRPYIICMSIHTIKVSVLEKSIFFISMQMLLIEVS